MSIGQRRIIAVVTQLAYLPASIFGIVSIWIVIAAVTTALLFRAELERLNYEAQSAKTKPLKLALFLTKAVLIAGVFAVIGPACGALLAQVVSLLPSLSDGKILDYNVFLALHLLLVTQHVLPANSINNFNAQQLIGLHSLILAAATFIVAGAICWRPIKSTMDHLSALTKIDASRLGRELAMFLGAGPFVALLLFIAAVVVIFSFAYEAFFGANYVAASLGVFVLAYG